MTDQIQLTAAVDIEAARGKSKRPAVSILAYGGGMMRADGFGEVVIDVDGIRAQGTIPLLVDHDNSVDGVAGSGTAEARDGKLYVNGSLASSEAAGKLVALHRDDVPLQASIGLAVDESDFVARGKTVNVNGRDIKASGNGFRLVKTGRLREVSIVAIGADASTAVSIAARRKDGVMSKDANDKTIEADPPADNVKADAERRDNIWASAMDYAGQYPDKAGELRAMAEKAIEAGQDPREYKIAAIEATQKADVLPWTGGPHNAGATDHQMLEASILCRSGYAEVAAKQYGERIVEAAERNPVTLKQMLEIKAQGFSTAAIGNVVSTLANKVAAAAYMLTPSTWMGYASIKSASDFKPGGAVRLNTLGTLEELGKDGEIKHATLGDDKFDFQIGTFAKMAAITRQDIVNDDAQLFSDIIPGLARMARRSLDDAVYKTLYAAVSGGTFYSSANGNTLTGTTSELTSESLGEAIELMRLQTDESGNPINITPTVLVVAPAFEMVARAILNSTEVRSHFQDASAPDASLPTGNPLQSVVRLEVEPRIGNSNFGGADTNWFLFGRPSDTPFIVAYLQGRSTPVVESDDTDFNTLGRQFRVYHDFATAVADPKASVYAVGA